MRKVFYILFFITFLFSAQNIFGQAGVFDQNDPDSVFTSTPPAEPANKNQVRKWGHAIRLAWNPYSYGYKSYYFRGMAYRLKYPKTYQQGVSDGKKYPLFLFFHGLGEAGSVYDNEYQLLHGGQTHAQAVNNGNYDGFLLYPQTPAGNASPYFKNFLDLMDSLTKYCKMDPDRVVLGGLSSGGQNTWDLVFRNPEILASITPISAARSADVPRIPNVLSIPVWISNGGLDTGPKPSTVMNIINNYRLLGGDIKQSFYPNQGHGVWNSFWAEPGYFDYLSKAHKANPMVLFQHTEFCPNDTIDAAMILQHGFYAYEWQKDGVTIAGAINDTLKVNEFGTYRARFKRTSLSDWSDWSPEPVIISPKDATVTPPIQIDGLHTNVLPAPDGSTTVPLIVPDTYVAYDWRRASDNLQVSTLNTLAAPIGQYKVQVTEKFGCSSSYSPLFNVINANGTNVPDKAADLTTVTLSNTSIDVFWNNNPSPINNETAFEVYRSTTSGSNYSLVAIIPADNLSFVDQGLLPNTTYYYIVRAVNENGAAPLSNEAKEITKSDTQAPSAPGNLVVTGITRHSVSLYWNAATDDAGVAKYDIYVNGQKAFVTDLTQFTLNNLDSFTTYSFYVRARDFSGNVSVPSNQVTAFTKYSGLNYKYYEGAWTVLPDFNTLTPVLTGTSANVDITVSPKTQNYGILWQGYIRIPVNGTYYFETGSDDGSRLYINTSYSFGATPLVNNDGTHGVLYAGGSIQLNAGLYPIAITFFQGGGGQGMGVYWTCADAGFPTRTAIPSAYFGDNNVGSGTVPNMPSNLIVTPVSYFKAHLTWTDGSSDETGFEIYRKGPSDIDFVMVGLSAANTSSFDDTLLTGNTTYSYKIQAVNIYGGSGFNSAITTITTPAAPGIPSVPKDLILQTLSSKMIQISFTDSSTQTGYEIQRSIGTPDNFRLFKLLSIKDSIVSLGDTSLYANTTYYYKVRALGISGNSAFTNYEMAATSNTKPILVDVQTFAMYYGSTKTIPITASDVDGDILTFSFNGMPAFSMALIASGVSDFCCIQIILNPFLTAACATSTVS